MAYFTAAQSTVYINDMFADEIFAVRYRVNSNTIPYYGYASQKFDAVIRGKYLVEGEILVYYNKLRYFWMLMRGGFDQMVQSAKDQLQTGAGLSEGGASGAAVKKDETDKKRIDNILSQIEAIQKGGFDTQSSLGSSNGSEDSVKLTDRNSPPTQVNVPSRDATSGLDVDTDPAMGASEYLLSTDYLNDQYPPVGTGSAGASWNDFLNDAENTTLPRDINLYPSIINDPSSSMANPLAGLPRITSVDDGINYLISNFPGQLGYIQEQLRKKNAKTDFEVRGGKGKSIAARFMDKVDYATLTKASITEVEMAGPFGIRIETGLTSNARTGNPSPLLVNKLDDCFLTGKTQDILQNDQLLYTGYTFFARSEV